MIELENDRRVLHQWELNQRVLLDGFKPGARVDFTLIAGTAEPLTVLAYEKGGHVRADIPNILLQKAGGLRVCVRPIYSDIATRQIKDLRIVPRDKPRDYVYTETVVLMMDTELNATMDEIIKYYAKKKIDDEYAKIRSDPAYAAMVAEVEQLTEKSKDYAFLCNKILQDCEKVLRLCNEVVSKKGGEE